MVAWGIAAAIAAIVTALQYAGRSRPLTLVAGACRFLALLLVAALALDAPAGRATPVASLVALDASASWSRGSSSDDARWRTARDSAGAMAPDSVVLFGDSARALPRSAVETAVPRDLASRVRPVVERALAAGRPLDLFTDGVVDDPDALRELPAGSRLHVSPAPDRPDLAVRDVAAPRAIVSGDTVEVQATMVAGAATRAIARATLLAGAREVASANVDPLPAAGEARVTLRGRIQMPEGPGVLRVVVHAAGDVEPRNDTVSVAVDVSPAAGAVWVSTAPDYDSRYALAVLRGAVSIPTRGYLRVAPGAWRVDGSLAPVSESAVRAAVRDAPLVVLHGDTAIFGAPRSLTRAPLALVVPATSNEEWYVSSAPASPIAPALADVAWDSLPPITTGGAAPQGEWVGVGARRARTGPARAIVTGSETDGQRVVTVVGSGLWRWRFRGGTAGDAFTSLWGSVFDWLAQARADRRAARPADRLFRAGDPIVWRRGSGRDSVVRVMLVPQRVGARADTLVLRFSGGATELESAPLAAGVYTARMPGGSALLAVNASRELLPAQPSVRSGAIGSAPRAGDAPRLRDYGWAYALAVLLLCAEWMLRRRIGLR